MPNASLAVAASACWDWEGLDHVYLAILTESQWLNLSRRVRESDVSTSIETGWCIQPAVAWTSLSLLSWREAQYVAPDGGADFALGGSEFIAASEMATPRPAPSPKAALRFHVQYTLPSRQDTYTLCVYNCLGTPLSIEGEATFRGGRGEALSRRQRDVLRVRLGFVVVTFASAVALALLCRHFRATTVPLHGLLVLVLFLRCVQQCFLLLPLVAASQNMRFPAGGIVMADQLDTYSSTTAAEATARATAQSDASGGSSNSPPAPPPPLGFGSAQYLTPAAAINATEWGLQRGMMLGAGAAEQLAALGFIAALLAVSAGRHFLFPQTPAREREALTAAFVLYFGFGMLQARAHAPRLALVGSR